MTITVYYTSIDGCRQKKIYKNLQKARAWAQYWIGEHPEIGSHYAVSGDGVGKITVDGASLYDLFPAPGYDGPEGEEGPDFEDDGRYQELVNDHNAPDW
jgi:hypothetical protein